MERGSRLGACGLELGAALEDADPVGGQHRSEERDERRAVGRAEKRRDVFRPDAAAGARGRLVEEREAVPEAARGRRGERGQRRSLHDGLPSLCLLPRVDDLEVLAEGDVLEAPGDLVVREAAEVETLAAGQDRRGNLVPLGRRQDEDCVRRRLFESLQEGLKGGRGDRVDLVDDEHLPAVTRGRVRHDFDEIARLVHFAVRGAVDLERVQRAALEHLHARRANPARSRRRPVGRAAVDRGREEARRRRLADPARPRKEVRVREPVGGNRVRERADDLVLPHDVREPAGPPFAGEGNVGGLVGHVETVLEKKGPSPPMSPGDPRRPGLSPECCFLPDLTRFGGDRRAGPELIRGPGDADSSSRPQLVSARPGR